MADRKKFYSRELADDLPDDPLTSDYFIIPGTDEKGHSARGQFRCSPDLDRQAEEVIASKQYPFKTKGDLFRWAVFDGLRRLIRYGYRIPDFTRELEMIHIVLRRKHRQATFDQALDALSRTVEELRRQGARGEIREILDEMTFQIEKCIENDPQWGNRYKEQFDRLFGRLHEELREEARKEGRTIDLGLSLRRSRNGDQ